jgi:hypothetical protein
MPLTRREYAFLKWAVGRAEEWRGELVGDPDLEGINNFDAAIKECKRILKKISPYRKRGTSN